ncbi:MAG TPA: hypothetical protein VD794_11350 [Flavisolibacter sp.]|nr:hypothetical protein [Flavisolibacter sp.]
MRKYAFTFFTTLFVLLNITGVAQENPWKPKARGQSDKGQWVVEIHKEDPEMKQVSFYANDNTLMYKEEIKTAKLNVGREKVLKRLEQLLNTIAIEWEKSKTITNHQLVLNYFN